MAAIALSVEDSFAEFLAREQTKDLLRFTTAGSVDDGKSTLIGRLLYDSRNVYEDQLESVSKASAGRNNGSIDFSLLTDGLRAEREQGITIDVAYRYFATPRRKFIIADTPGHEQYTRNMVTGASTAELAIILVDARKGLLPQSRRHAYIASLLGLPHAVIAVNKMDLVDYSESVFRQIETDFRQFLSEFHELEPYFIPISALAGDNVVTRSTRMPWFSGPSLLEHLEEVPVGNRPLAAPFRFPVQRVVRPNHEFRGYAGTLVSGQVSVGDKVIVLPSGRTTMVTGIVTFDGDLKTAHAGQSVTLTLADEIDIARGDMIAAANRPPEIGTSIEATLVWLNEVPADLNRRYRIKHTTRLGWADLEQIHYRTNILTLDAEPAQKLEMNAIGSVTIDAARPLIFDKYTENRATGSFILIDEVTNSTVAAGLITGNARATSMGGAHSERLSLGERVRQQGHAGAVIRLGDKQTLAWSLERHLFNRGCTVFALEKNPGPELMAAGALVLVAGPSHHGFFIETPDGKAEIDPESLSESDSEAVLALERLLERLQILLPPPSFSDSGGI